MSVLALPSPLTGTARAVILISESLKPHLSPAALRIETSTSDQGAARVTLKTGSNETLTTASKIVRHIVNDLANQGDRLLATTDNDNVQIDDYLDKLDQYDSSSEARKQLDSELSHKTFLVADKASAADYGLVASLYPFVSTATHQTLLSMPSLTRHFDHVQNDPLVKQVLSSHSAFQPGLVKIDLDNVPPVELKQEPKPKKAAAAATQAQDKTPSTATTTKAAAAPAAPAAEGQPKKGEKQPKKEKAPKEPKPAATPAVAESPAPWMVDMRVGKIVDVQLHPDADSLYVEKIDVGEPEPRTVISGLVKHVPIEQMRNKTLVAICNLKPVSMRGIKSHAMVLCASSPLGKDVGVELIDPPQGSLPGDRVYFEGFKDKQALELMNPKKKIFETVQPGFTTLETKECAWVDKESGSKHRIMTDKGVCTAPTVVGGSLS